MKALEMALQPRNQALTARACAAVAAAALRGRNVAALAAVIVLLRSVAAAGVTWDGRV